MNVYFPKKSAFFLCFMLLALTTLVSAGEQQQLRRRELKKSSKSSKSKSSKSPTNSPSQSPSQSPSEEIIPIVTVPPTSSPTGTPSSSPTKTPKSTKSPKKSKSPKSSAPTAAPTPEETINQAPPAFEVAFIVLATCDAADPSCSADNLKIENLKAYEDQQCLDVYNPNNKCPGTGKIAVGLAVDVFETTTTPGGSGRKLQQAEKTYDVKVTTTSDNEADAQGSSANAVDSTEDVRDAVAQNVDGYTATPAPPTDQPTPAPVETLSPGRSRRLVSNHRVPVKPSRGQAAFASHRLANANKASRKLMKGGMMNRRLKSVVKPRA